MNRRRTHKRTVIRWFTNGLDFHKLCQLNIDKQFELVQDNVIRNVGTYNVLFVKILKKRERSWKGFYLFKADGDDQLD